MANAIKSRFALLVIGRGKSGVRYLVMRDLLCRAPDDMDLKSARVKAHREGPISTVLNEMHNEGYWEKEGPGYGPKYRSTVWSIILLGQLGASLKEDPRIEKACRYLLKTHPDRKRAIQHLRFTRRHYRLPPGEPFAQPCSTLAWTPQN